MHSSFINPESTGFKTRPAPESGGRIFGGFTHQTKKKFRWRVMPSSLMGRLPVFLSCPKDRIFAEVPNQKNDLAKSSRPRPGVLLETAALLGLFVAFASAYGVLYALGRLRRRRRLRLAAYLSYGLQCLVTVAVLRFTPLGVPWKLLVAFSCLAYLGIPPVTWRHLESTHRSGEIDHAAQSP